MKDNNKDDKIAFDAFLQKDVSDCVNSKVKNTGLRYSARTPKMGEAETTTDMQNEYHVLGVTREYIIDDSIKGILYTEYDNNEFGVKLPRKVMYQL